MQIAEAHRFLRANHRGVFVCHKRDGSPHITLVTPGIDAEGRVIITTRGTTYKLKNVRRDPRVSMLVMGEQFSGSNYVQLQGTAKIIEQPAAMDLLIYWYRQLRGEHSNWEEYREKMREERRAIIRVNIEKVGPQNTRQR
jgi:PPOX class probable F420-dependent enzyme